MIQFRCRACGFVHPDNKPPSHCPICGVGSRMFEETNSKKDEEKKEKEKKNKQP